MPYTPIHPDDHANLERACAQKWPLAIVTTAGERLDVEAGRLRTRREAEYLVAKADGRNRELRLDKIVSFSNPVVGRIVVRHG